MSGVMVVTGGSRGIGAAIATLAGERGYKVVVNFNTAKDRAAQVMATIEQSGSEAIAVQADMAKETDIVRLFEETDTAFGPVTALINNAGIASGYAYIADVELESLERVFAINTIGPMLCAREAIRRMSTKRGGKGGVIVNISSRASVHGRLVSEVPYAAAKGAIDAFTIGLATELAQDGIRVAAIRPGLILTEIFEEERGFEAVHEMAKTGVPMGRPGEPEEIASAAVWLCSEEASYVTGAILDVGGGR